MIPLYLIEDLRLGTTLTLQPPALGRSCCFCLINPLTAIAAGASFRPSVRKRWLLVFTP